MSRWTIGGIIAGIALVVVALGYIFLPFRHTDSASHSFGKDSFAESKASMRFEGMPSAFTAPTNLANELADAPIPTNRWWESAVTGTWPETLFSTPFTYNLSAEGIKAGVPPVIASADGIITPLQSDIALSFPGTTLSRSEITHYDDLSLTLRALSETNQPVADSHLVQGSPLLFTTLYVPTDILLPSATTTSRRLADGRYALSFSIRDQSYVIYSDSVLTLPTPQRAHVEATSQGSTVVIAALPTAEQPADIVEAFDRASSNPIQTTSADIVEGSTNKVRLRWKTQQDQPSLYLLLPHQRMTEQAAPASLGRYATLQGNALLIEGNELTVSYPEQSPLDSLPLPKEDGFFKQETLEGFLTEATFSAASPAGTSYFGAKELYRLANLVDIANKANSPSAPQLQAALKQELTNWFTYSPGEESKYFYYDQRVKGLVAVTPEFDSDKFNDHHFHYGYFIYASAILGRYDQQFVQDYKPAVDALVADIANTDRANTSFPYLRVVDLYAGHSWAGGLSRFGDGNNQESVSEAINAWYGTMLWGKTSNNHHLENLGHTLYNQEVAAAQTYWFNANPLNPFPAQYAHYNAPLRWSGKATFETWFSPKAEDKHTILYLPLSPGSLYLQQHGIISNDLAALNKELNGKPADGWQDILLMARALENPAEAINQFSASITLDNSNSLAYTYVWLAWLSQR